MSAASKKEKIPVRIVYTTDLHGYLVSDSVLNGQKSNHGLAHILTAVDKLRQSCDELILFDNGDLISGSLVSMRCGEDMRFSHPMIAALNENDCRFAVLGNHEFDFGRKYLDKIVEQSEFPWLAANVIDKKSKLPAFGPSFYMHETKTGKKIAFIGLCTPETADLVLPDTIEGLKFLAYNAVLPSLIKQVKAEGADFIVVCSHGGYDENVSYWNQANEGGEVKRVDCALTEDYSDIDLLLTGHTHGRFSGRTQSGTPTLQAGCYGHLFGSVELCENEEAQLEVQSLAVEGVAGNAPQASSLELTEKVFQATSEWLDEEVAISEADLRPDEVSDCFLEPSRMGSLIHRVLQTAGQCDLSAACYWDLEGWAPGPVTRRKLLNLVPDNYIYVLELSGVDIRAALERSATYYSLSNYGECLLGSKVYEYDTWSGLSYAIDISLLPGGRICNLLYKGERLSKKKKYKVSFYHFRAGGALGYSMLQNGKVIWKSKKTVRDYLMEFMKRYPKLIVPIEKNWKVLKDGEQIFEARMLGR